MNGSNGPGEQPGCSTPLGTKGPKPSRMAIQRPAKHLLETMLILFLKVAKKGQYREDERTLSQNTP